MVTGILISSILFLPTILQLREGLEVLLTGIKFLWAFREIYWHL